jgi:S1-C subfamily serine protease
MSTALKAFLGGLAISAVILISFLGGAIADRVFVIKPLNGWLGTRQPWFAPQQVGNPSSNVGPTELNPAEKSVVDVAASASQSVVTVAIKKTQAVYDPTQDPFSAFGLFGFQFRRPRSSGQTKEVQADIGSGFVVDKNGLVVTNKHVVSDDQAGYLVIDKAGKEHKVEKMYRDPVNDLAILKVADMSAPAIALGDSDQIKVGQSVIAIGTALGEFRHTVTTGVVSGLGRGIEAGDQFGTQSESLDNVIQTDAAINPGNSGGPLLDSNGRVIGVNVAVSAQGQNIGFAIPINVIKSSIENFNSTGQFDRPLLGIRYQMISQQAALMNEVPQGAYVIEVVPESSAAVGGVKQGDIISDVDGKTLKETELAKIISQKKIGDKVKIKYWRDGKENTVEVTLKGQ